MAPIAGFAAIDPHPSLVPETPHILYPKVLNTPSYTSINPNCPNGCVTYREVLAADQAGKYLVAGGNFWNVRTRDGVVHDQKYLSIANINTDDPACLGAFTVNGYVRAVEPAAVDGQVYIGGEFTWIIDSTGVQHQRSKIALLDLDSCTVVTSFTSTGVDSRVTELVLSGNRLFVGGDFTTIGGQNISYVAEVDPSSGAVRPSFRLQFGSNQEFQKVRGMGVNDAGTRLLFGGRFGSVSDGIRNLTTLTAIVDISNPTTPRLTAHRFTSPHPLYYLQDVAIAPDASSIGVVFGAATVYDYVYLVGAGESTQSMRWRHYMRDTTGSIGISNNAVYVGGHFCKPDSGPGSTQTMSPLMGLNTCTGSVSFNGGVWRTHVAALSLTNGTPLTWNPGANSNFGAREMTVTSRGLIMGMDGQAVNNYVDTGALVFFDFGTPADNVLPSDVTYTSPTAWSTVVGSPVTVTGTATDNNAVEEFRLRVYSADLQYLQPDGSLSTNFYEFRVPAVNGAFSVDLPVSPGTFIVSGRAVDAAGNSSPNWAKLGFIDVDQGDVVPPSDVTYTSPTAWSTVVGSPVTVTGTATDDISVEEFRLRVYSADLRICSRWFVVDELYEFRVPAVNGAFSVDLPVSPGTFIVSRPGRGCGRELVAELGQARVHRCGPG
ncbi:MAG: hypothetical protein R2715_23165 [Ilumatobacteraceae bacterium]